MQINKVRFILKHVFKLPREISLLLGGVNQMCTCMAVLHLDEMWQKLPLYVKFKTLTTFKWFPSNETIEGESKKILMNGFFGREEDFGEVLYILTAWLHSRTWSYDKLTEADIIKFKALSSVAITTNLRHGRVTSDFLHLKLVEKVPDICLLIPALVVKLPVISIRFCLELNTPYSFQSIREAEHPMADKLVAYLYEILSIQQKIAVSFHELVQHMDKTAHKDAETTLMMAEIDALKEISVIVMELKATVEKSVVFLGLIYGIDDLESKKHHKQKLSALDRGVPQSSKDKFYYSFISSMISSEHLEELNNYRSGLFHKVGLSKLQPHSFVSKKPDETPLVETFMFLNEQHAKNTATLICILALLTDDLINKKLPEVGMFEYLDILSANHTLKVRKYDAPFDPSVSRNFYGFIPYEKIAS